jgi:hypothetical protein
MESHVVVLVIIHVSSSSLIALQTSMGATAESKSIMFSSQNKLNMSSSPHCIFVTSLALMSNSIVLVYMSTAPLDPISLTLADVDDDKDTDMTIHVSTGIDPVWKARG